MFTDRGRPGLSRYQRKLIEREVKKLLLEEAKRRGVSLDRIIEWLREDHGLSIGGKLDWNKVEKIILSSDDISSYELAAFLQEEGVDIPEDKWLSILRKHGINV